VLFPHGESSGKQSADFTALCCPQASGKRKTLGQFLQSKEVREKWDEKAKQNGGVAR